MPYRAVFIDLDNTIWDFENNSRTSLEISYNKFQYDRFFKNFESFYSLYHCKNDALWALYREGKIDKDSLNKERFCYPLRCVGIQNNKLAMDFGKDYLDTLPEQNKLIPHAFDVLSYLKGKYHLFILSNGFKEVQYKKLENAGICQFFTDVILSDHVGYNKPDKRIFEAATKAADSTTNQCIMIGDDWDADIIGAKNAGIDQIYYNPNSLDKNQRFTPTFTARTLLDIKDIL